MRIALIGFGLEARSAYNFLRKEYPEAEFDVYDENPETKVPLPNGVIFFGSCHDFSTIKADLIVRTPAVNPRRLPRDIKVTTVTNLFFEKCPAQIIGVTGSKGKGTVSSFIAEILRSAGLRAHVLGNIGIAALDELAKISKDDVVVYELSSFQLWDMEKSPHIAIINNIEPDHLDVHDSFEDYVLAKMNIAVTQNESDLFIYNSKNQILVDLVDRFKGRIKSKLQTFPNSNFAHFKDGYFFWGDKPIFETSIVKIPGEHNLKNSLVAMTATFDILRQKGFDDNSIFNFWKQGISRFEGLSHRLKFVRSVNGVDFYDDSIATTEGSAIVAMDTFDRPKVLIIGGSSKGVDINNLISKIAQSTSNELRKVILIGAESANLAKRLTQEGFTDFDNLGQEVTMKEIVETSFRYAKSGDVVILSPAHASFDMFKSYVDRGDKFIEAVHNIRAF